MDDIFSIVRTTIGSVLDFPPHDRDRDRVRQPPAVHQSTVVTIPPHGARDQNCVDMLLRLLGGCGATEKRINALPVVTLRRQPGHDGCKADGCKGDHAHADEECGGEEFQDPTAMFDQDTCSICLDTFEDSDTVRVLGCCHVYHAQCIEIWLRRRPTCPMCNLTAC